MRKMMVAVVEGKEIFVGLEDSKRTWKLCVRCEGMVVAETSMPAEYDNLRQYLSGRYPGCEIGVMYEAGFGGFWLHDRLVADGVRCVVTPPNKVTQEKVNKVKTDRIDACRLARNLENGDYVVCSVPDRERREDRQISRTLLQLQQTLTATRNRIRKFLDFHGLNGSLPSGAWRPSQYRELPSLSLDHSLQVCLDSYLELVDKLESLQAGLLAELKVLCTKDRYCKAVRSKQSCPGVGWLSAIRFTLEWGDLCRFSSGKKMASFTGLTSREYSSGDTIHRGRITGQGAGHVRGWLIQCAWRAIKLDPALLDKFRRVRENTGSKKKAIVAVARMLAVRMRAIEITGQPYSVAVIE